MRITVSKPYGEDKWAYYGILAHRTAGKTLPMTFENSQGENAIISSGALEDGVKYFQIKTAQKNGWLAVSTYYEDGTAEETYEK